MQPPTQVDPIHTPDKFYMGQIIDEGLPTERTVYDLTYDEEVVAVGKKLRRKVKGGQVQSVHVKDDTSVDVYLDDQLVATWFIQGQYEQNGWQDFNRQWQYVDVVDGHIQGSGTQGAFEWDIDIPCLYGEQDKWTVNVVAPGFTVRMIWEITLTALGQQLFADGDLVLSTEEFTGELSDDEGTEVRTIIFEPSGSVDGIVVDPYLRIDEQSTYVDVYCDGYVVNLRTDSAADYQGRIYDPSKTDVWGYLYSQVIAVSSTYYHLPRDPSLTVEIISNTPTRVVIRITGNFYDNGGTSYLAGSNKVTEYYYIYSDRYCHQIIWDTDGQVTIDNFNQAVNAPSGIIEGDAVSFSGIYESTGSESTGSVNNSTSDYIGLTASGGELIIIGSCLEQSLESGTATFAQVIPSTDDDAGFIWNNGTVGTAATNEIHTMTVMWIIDSADREYGSKKYTSTERLEMGDQYNDTTLADPITGSWVDDLVIPANIGVDGFAADGGHHVEPASDVAKITWDRTRHNPVVPIHDFGIYTGVVGSETDHLIGHWKCDDNAATTTIVDETGNYNGTLAGGGNTEDKDNTDAVRGTSFLLNGTADYLDLSSALAGLTDGDIGSIMLRFKPNFAYNVATDQYLFSIHLSGEYFSFYYDASTYDFDLGSYVNTTSVTIDVPGGVNPYNSEPNKLQLWHTLLVSWDTVKDKMICVFDGQVFYSSGLGTGFAPDSFYIGRSNGSVYGAYYIDEIKLFNGCLLPYGGGPFVGNGEVNTDVAHDDVLFYADGSEGNTDSPDIGSGTFTVSGATQTTDVEGNANSAWLIDGASEQVYFPCYSGYNITPNQGSIFLWYKETTGPESYGRFFYHTSAADAFECQRQASDTALRWKINSTYLDFTVASPFDTTWHWMWFSWDCTNDIYRIYIDGILQQTVTTACTAPALASGNMEIGSVSGTNDIGGAICDFFITNDPNTPDRWSVFGKPIHYPLCGVS